MSGINASYVILYTGVFLATEILNNVASPSSIPSLGVHLIVYSLASALVTSVIALS